MITVNKLKITLQQVANSDIILITGVREVKEFQDGRPTDRTVAYSYTVVCPANKYEQFNLKVEQKQPVITNEELEARGGAVKARVKGFEGKFYQNKNKDILFTAKAIGIEVVV